MGDGSGIGMIYVAFAAEGGAEAAERAKSKVRAMLIAGGAGAGGSSAGAASGWCLWLLLTLRWRLLLQMHGRTFGGKKVRSILQKRAHIDMLSCVTAEIDMFP